VLRALLPCWAGHDVARDKKLEIYGEDEIFMNALICDLMGYRRCVLICYMSYDKLLAEKQIPVLE
jgi:hypothetical protein